MNQAVLISHNLDDLCEARLEIFSFFGRSLGWLCFSSTRKTNHAHLRSDFVHELLFTATEDLLADSMGTTWHPQVLRARLAQHFHFVEVSLRILLVGKRILAPILGTERNSAIFYKKIPWIVMFQPYLSLSEKNNIWFGGWTPGWKYCIGNYWPCARHKVI